MLTLVYGSDWTANRDHILLMLANDVAAHKPNRILLVPELISHDTERRLCAAAGNTCSRFAEVLSFTRLTKRICDWSNCGMQDCLDDGGRLVSMAAAARQLHSKLKAYASLETKPEFLSDLVDTIDEFKRCCISSQDLAAASKQATGSFAQKLEELSLLLDAYDAICLQGKRDPRDQLTWGLEQLQECSFAQEHVFYIDGFPDFTMQNMAIISHMIQYSPHVIISFNCDKPGSNQLAWTPAWPITPKRPVKPPEEFCGSQSSLEFLLIFALSAIEIVGFSLFVKNCFMAQLCLILPSGMFCVQYKPIVCTMNAC